MREGIGLYKAKRIDNGEWIEGFFHYAHWINPKTRERVGTSYYILPLGQGDAFKVDPETVGQWTTLTDKNGVKIFEGDVLNTSNSNCRIWYVDYKKAAFCANQGNANYACELSEFMDTTAVEVIGNIHDEKAVEG